MMHSWSWVRLVWAAMTTIGYGFVCVGADCSPICTKDGAGTRTANYRAEFVRGEFRFYSSGARTPDLTYKLSSIQLGGELIRLRDLPRVRSAGNVVCYYHGDLLSESYTSLQDGVEQCWVINKRPRSPGDMIIRGEITSPHRVTSSLCGMNFLDERGRAVVSYGAVTAIDSSGLTYRCMPEVRGNRLTITLPRSYVETARFPILVDPVVGPERLICPSFNPAPGNQEAVRIASSQQGYLAVWQDSRGSAGTDIYATRVTPSGEVIDLMGICVSNASGDQASPAAAWNGKEYLVVWGDRRSANQHIYAARVRPDGEVIDKQGILVSGTTASQSAPSVASDGFGWLVVWQDSKGSSLDIYGCVVNMDGVPGKTYGISTRLDNEQTPDVAFNGTTYLVTWTDLRNAASTDTDIYGCRVARSGIRTGSDILVSSKTSATTGAPGPQRNPRLCAYGSTYLAVWEDERNKAGEPDIYGARVDGSGNVLDRNGIAVTTATDSQEMPSVGYNGGKFLVAWRSLPGRLVRGARVSTGGTVLDPNPVALSLDSAGSSGTAVSACGNSFMVGWASLDVSNADILSTTVTDAGVPQHPAGTTLSIGLDAQFDYSVAYNGSGYVVVWSQYVSGSYSIMAAKLSSTGDVLTPTPVNLTPSAGNRVQPSIAWNGVRYLVVWSTNESYASSQWDIRGVRLDQNLAKLGTVTVCTAYQDQARPTVASNGSNFLVVWEDYRNAESPYYYGDLYGAMVSSSGSVTAISSAISSGARNQLKPRAASNGSNYFVVWEDYRNAYASVRGTRITSPGTIQDADGIPVPSTSYIQTSPDVCYGAGNYLVTWSDRSKISGCRITVAGIVLDSAGVVVDTGSGTKYAPKACWDGAKYEVVWEDYRSASEGNSDVFYGVVNSNGGVPSDPRIALVSDFNAQLAPRVFATGASGVLFYTRNYNSSSCTSSSTLQELPLQEMEFIGSLKELPTGSQVAVNGKVVTAAFSDCFYIEELNRSCGIKVVSPQKVNVNDTLEITGSVTTSDGERQLNASGVAVLGVSNNPPAPFGIRGDWLGGGRLNSHVPGITGAYGLNNIGLLATTWGKVTITSSDSFYIECTSSVRVKVRCGGLLKPQIGKTVSVTGISTCEAVAGAIQRVMRPRAQTDIVVLN